MALCFQFQGLAQFGMAASRDRMSKPGRATGTHVQMHGEYWSPQPRVGVRQQRGGSYLSTLPRRCRQHDCLVLRPPILVHCRASNIDLGPAAEGNQNQNRQSQNKQQSKKQLRRRSDDLAISDDSDTERTNSEREEAMYESDVGDEFDDHDPLDDETNARIIDLDTGRELDCYVNQVVELNGVGYAVCYPLDQPVVIATLTSAPGGFEQELIAIEDEEKINELFPVAYAIASESDMILTRSAYVMTLAGYEDDVGEYEDSESDLEQGENAFSDDDDESFEDSNEDVEVLFEFYHKNVEYMVCKPLDPVLFVARPLPRDVANGVENAYYVPEKDELDAILPQVEAAMESSIIGDA
ncbi:hypothetical protein FVE85_5696 [Porphyridium purpureum]|uniref:DUF3727 domain-containing protein n=1 Tax=Porphyridium purpureum TaxID=35688 RepID=A0A5J4Z2N6_PORPP|nr:hypothetical protein FVE85_5696 [Porphyridium purpureum]|eukprot:POR8241..scf295_1